MGKAKKAPLPVLPAPAAGSGELYTPDEAANLLGNSSSAKTSSWFINEMVSRGLVPCKKSTLYALKQKHSALMEADAEEAKKEAAVEKATEENEKAVLESQAAMARLERSELRKNIAV